MLYSQPLVDLLIPQLRRGVAALATPPHLVILLVGDDPASRLYVRRKQALAEQVGCTCTIQELPADTSQDALHQSIDTLNTSPDVTGLILQLPLPKGLNRSLALARLSARKDVDGLSPPQADKLLAQAPDALLPATPLGIMRLLRWANVPLEDKDITVVGTSQLVGGPVADLLRQAGARVTSCNRQTPNIPEKTRGADVLIVAAGQPDLITGSMVKDGAAIIDVGINIFYDDAGERHLVGDVKTSDVTGKAALLTPVPGGVGPMTVVSLITNLVDAACLQAEKPRVEWHITPRT